MIHPKKTMNSPLRRSESPQHMTRIAVVSPPESLAHELTTMNLQPSFARLDSMWCSDLHREG